MTMTRSVLVGGAMLLGGCSEPPSVALRGDVHAQGAPAARQPEATTGLDWRTLEHPLLVNHVQVTSRDRFVKAGEAYFDHQNPPVRIIFQAVEVPSAGKEVEPFYAMYVAKLSRDAGGRITGTEPPVRISPEGSANTCGWFHPTSPGNVIFGSTLTRPASDQKSGFQVGARKYVWMFPAEMEIVYATLDRPGSGDAKAWFTRPNYDAECSYSRDGRFILYAHVRDEQTRGRPDADIFIYDTRTGEHHPIVVAEGYDGGPFFSPDGKRICYRSDRRGDDLLQLFVADLKFDGEGVPVGIEKEYQVTDDQAVNWAPFWHPSGRFLVYGSSAVDPKTHSNYEVYAVEVDPAKATTALRKRRVTFGAGADVLPVFSDDGKLFMWTAQRGPLGAGEQKPSSQLWIAEVNPHGGFASPEHLFDNLPDQRPEGATPAGGPALSPHP
jgi:hypothetical protein